MGAPLTTETLDPALLVIGTYVKRPATPNRKAELYWIHDVVGTCRIVNEGVDVDVPEQVLLENCVTGDRMWWPGVDCLPLTVVVPAPKEDGDVPAPDAD